MNVPELAEAGKVAVSGGCEVHGEMELSFAPAPDGVAMQVRNEQWLYDLASRPLPGFAATLSHPEAGTFFAGLREAVEAARGRTGTFSTRQAVVAVHLPLADGILDADLREDTVGEAIEPILDRIDAFARAHAPSRDGRPTTGAGSPPENATARLLGGRDERSRAAVEVSQGHALHGATEAIVCGGGPAAVRLVRPAGRSAGGPGETRYVLDLSGEQIASVFDALIAADVAALPLPAEPARPGRPDESLCVLAVHGAGGDGLSIGVWADDTPPPDVYASHPRKAFDDACLAVRRVVLAAADGARPVYSGPQDRPGWDALRAALLPGCLRLQKPLDRRRGRQ